MGLFNVTKVSEGPVQPSAATPSETLPLAWVDRYPTHRGLVESVHVYLDSVSETGDSVAQEKKTKPPAAVVRGALADALVHYYPFAGRIVDGDDDRPAVLCSAEGVYFVEATANCTLANVNFLERPLLLDKEQLVPYPTPELWAVEPQNSLAMIQVTTFTCGGFVIGLRTNHAVADGTGAAQFLNAVGDLARGLPEPRVKPVWGRDRFPDPEIKPGPLPELPALALEYIAFDFPVAYLDKIKSQYFEFTGGRHCSAFDIVIAKLWQCRTRAIGPLAIPGADVKLCFFASARHVLKLEPGYWGNAIFPVKVSAPAEKVAGSSVVELVGVVRESKRRMAGECQIWAEGRTGGRDPFQMTFDYESVYVSDWSKLGFSDVDYGYGKPTTAGPLVNCDLIASVIVMKAPAPLSGTRLLASCVTEEHAHPFTEEAIEQIKKDGITKLVVLPLYPQFSISTSGSSLRLLESIFREDEYLVNMQHTVIPSWYQREGYIKAMATLIEKELLKFPKPQKVMIFFSAHGVPLAYVEEAGDPYKAEMEECVDLIMEELEKRGMENPCTLAYQSRVGPVEWLKPYTDETIIALGQRGVKSLLAVPISFVSEHIETLEEIDVEYKELALQSGIKHWGRVPALGCEPTFISDLADAVIESLPYVGAMAVSNLEARQSLVPLGSVEELLAAYDSKRDMLPPPVIVWEWGWTKSAETWNGRAAMLAVLALLVLEVTTGQGLLHQWGILPPLP